MTDETKARLEQIIQAVFNSPEGECCQNCITKSVIRECHTEGLRVSRLNVEARVKAVIKASWDEGEPSAVH